MTGKKETIRGAAVIVIAIVYYYLSTQIAIHSMLSTTMLDSASMPKLWGVLLLLLGIIMLIRGIVACKKEAKALPAQADEAPVQKESFGAWLKKNYSVVGSFVVLGLYVFLFQPLGFILSTVLFLFAMVLLLSRKEERKPLIAVIVAIAATALLYVIFDIAFKIPLPKGILKALGI